MNFEVVGLSRYRIQDFIEKWHYSKNMNGVMSKYCFGLYRESELIGAAVFGDPATPGVAEAYGNSVIELRRLCCVDDTPKNTESYFIGKMVRWLRLNTDIQTILSYADTTHGHTGIIYQASNFELVGQSPAVKKILWKGRIYHDKAQRTKYNGILKPFSKELAEAVKSGEATWIETKPKNIYTYQIKRKKRTPKLGQQALL